MIKISIIYFNKHIIQTEKCYTTKVHEFIHEKQHSFDWDEGFENPSRVSRKKIRSSYDLSSSRVCFIHSEPEVEGVLSQ